MKKKIVQASGEAQGKTLLIAAGGTGGHITPGISIAEHWLALGGKIILTTLMKNIEYPDIVRIARNENVTIVAYDAPRLTKNPLQMFGFFRRFRSAYRLVKQVATAEHATAVLGMGGYSSFPTVAYAILNRKPLFLCEQNAHWGMVTRRGKSFAKAVFLSFPEIKQLASKFIVTGNPLRAMFKDKGDVPRRKTKAGKKNILFLGGSQGATDINALYLSFVNHPAAAKYHCTVAAGGSAFAALSPKARKGDAILPFIEDMPAAYDAADVIVARCGSGTLFEILWSEKPSFLIPYPFAADDHQKANAEALAGQMPSAIYDERPFSADNALTAFLSFLGKPPATATKRPETRAEVKIARYILENLNHAAKH
jgi:UDP-N-acetylglucosamine--N-acetylmuramyl-(pentapeptide) pyrophosphoryl-undecaprenol N-acetylglucosamine transferase